MSHWHYQLMYKKYDRPNAVDAWGLDDRITLWRITYDKETGLNPVIEVEGEG